MEKVVNVCTATLAFAFISEIAWDDDCHRCLLAPSTLNEKQVLWIIITSIWCFVTINRKIKRRRCATAECKTRNSDTLHSGAALKPWWNKQEGERQAQQYHWTYPDTESEQIRSASLLNCCCHNFASCKIFTRNTHRVSQSRRSQRRAMPKS